MLEALKTAPGGAAAFRRTVRWNLGAWLGQVQKPLRIMDMGTPCDFLGISPDGKTFGTGYSPFDQTNATPIELWDIDTGLKLRSLPGAFGPFAFRRDGKALFACAGDRRMVAVDVVTGQILWKTQAFPGPFTERVNVSPDGSTVFVDCNDGALHSWLVLFDAVTGEQRGEALQGHSSVAVAPDGRTAATGRIENGEEYVDLLELPSGRRARSWRLSGRRLYQLQFSPDAKSLYGSVLEGDLFRGNTRLGQIWEANTGRPTSPLMGETAGTAYIRAGDRLVMLSDGQSTLREATSGRVLGAAFLASRFVAAHPGGRLLLAPAEDHTIRLWQIAPDAQPVSSREATKQDMNSRVSPDRQTRGFSVFRAGLRPDGQVAVSLAKDAADRELVRLSDPLTGRPVGRPAAHYPGWIVRAAGMSPDGRILATGSNPHTIPTGELRLWDASTGQLLLPPIPHTNYVSALVFHPAGKLLAVGDYNGLVRFWDTTTGTEIGRPLAQGEIVLSVAFSPDGSMLAVGLALAHARKPGTRLWNTVTRQPIGDILSSTERISRLEFRPDGQGAHCRHRSSKHPALECHGAEGADSANQRRGKRRLWPGRSSIPHAGKRRDGQASRCGDRRAAHETPDRALAGNLCGVSP